MTAPMDCRLVGRWRIVEADLWDRDHLDLVAPAAMTIGADGRGEIAYGAMQASLELEYSRSTVFFTWAGFDEMDQVSGSGSAELTADGTIEIAFAYHLGDEAVLKAERITSSTACYWTGVVEIGGTAGKFVFEPTEDENHGRALRPGERHLSEEWRARQAKGDIAFRLCWLPFANQQDTPTVKLTEPWVEQRRPVGQLRLPQIRPEDGEQAALWAALAAEMGASPAHWVRDRGDTIARPGTEFGVARQIAYQASQAGRDALPQALYADVFRTGRIGPALAAELRRRRAAKRAAGHVDRAPDTSA